MGPAMPFERRRVRQGVALGVALTIVGSLGSAVGFSSHPVGEESHPVFNPRNKNCQGDPPRQTEDPLSPPCVPFFDGDNGGRTYRGVTRDSIRIILYNDLGLEGDLNTPYRSDQEQVGHETSTNGEQTYLVRTTKALVRYFANHHQTYNRAVQMIAVPSNSGITTPCASRKVEAAVINREYAPFAVTTLGDNMDCFIDEMATFGVPTFGGGRDVYDGSSIDARMVWTFHPSLADQTAASAAFLCDKLVGLRARYSPDPALSMTARRFALLYPVNSQRGPTSAIAAGELLDDLDARCGLEPGDAAGKIYVRTYVNSGQPEAVRIFLDLKLKGITTVICYCVPTATELTVSTFQSAATALQYRPEWYWDTASRMYRAPWHRQHGSRAQVSFGITPDWAAGRIEERFPWRAYREIAPGTEPNTRFLDDIYHSLLVLFNGVQLAGPELTPTNAADGLQTLHLRTGSPYLADGGFEASKGADAFAFRDRYLPFWWDPSGLEPGRGPRDGCVRSSLEIGSAAGWEGGDEGVVGGGTCLGSPMQVPATDPRGLILPLPWPLAT